METEPQNIGNTGSNVISAAEYRQRKIAIKKPKIYESSVVDACIKWLWNNKCFIWRHNTATFATEAGGYVKCGAKGSPDIVGMTPAGRFIGVECKGSTGKLQPHQKEFGDKIIAHGGIYIVAFSIDDLEKRRGEIVGEKCQ